MNDSVKYYWMAYEVRDASMSYIAGMAASKHPLDVIFDLQNPRPLPALPGIPPLGISPTRFTLISWQEISVEEYRVARKRYMADEPPPCGHPPGERCV